MDAQVYALTRRRVFGRFGRGTAGCRLCGNVFEGKYFGDRPRQIRSGFGRGQVIALVYDQVVFAARFGGGAVTGRDVGFIGAAFGVAEEGEVLDFAGAEVGTDVEAAGRQQRQ